MKHKRAALGFLSLLAAVSLCACSNVKSKEYDTVCKAQAEVASMTSGKLTVMSRYENSRKNAQIKSEFTFSQTPDGKLAYCQTQTDSAGKIIYCDYSDGQKAEQWFIGKGWSEASRLSYSTENPHRYIRLIASPHSKEVITELVSSPNGADTQYTLTMNAQELNKTTYMDADFEVISQSIVIVTDKDGKLTSYDDTAQISDKATKTPTEYGLSITLSDANASIEIKRPDLRDYSSANAEIEEEKK